MRGIIVKTVLSLLIFSILMLATGCQAAPIISPDEVINIRNTLGYVIAPTWLAEDLTSHFDNVEPPQSSIQIIYTRGTSRILFVSYPAELPADMGGSNPLMEYLELDWQPPDDTTTMIEVNGEEGYYTRGYWSAKTMEAFTNPDELHNITPEWDYDYAKRLYFRFTLLDGEEIDVLLAVMYNPDWISQEEMIKIAESCVQVE